jgi:transcription termination factor Rho
MGTMDAIEFINSKLKETKSNADFFSSMNKPIISLIFILDFL